MTLLATGKPDPSFDFEADWVYNGFWDPGLTNGPLVDGTSILWGFHLDLRAQRRIHELNDQYVMVLKNGGSATLTVSAFTRTLLKLP
jgi:hypothetical protein